MPEPLVTLLLVIERCMVNPRAALQASGDDPVTTPGYNDYYTPARLREWVGEPIISTKTLSNQTRNIFWGCLTRSCAVCAILFWSVSGRTRVVIFSSVLQPLSWLGRTPPSSNPAHDIVLWRMARLENSDAVGEGRAMEAQRPFARRRSLSDLEVQEPRCSATRMSAGWPSELSRKTRQLTCPGQS